MPLNTRAQKTCNKKEITSIQERKDKVEHYRVELNVILTVGTCFMANQLIRKSYFILFSCLNFQNHQIKKTSFNKKNKHMFCILNQKQTQIKHKQINLCGSSKIDTST